MLTHPTTFRATAELDLQKVLEDAVRGHPALADYRPFPSLWHRNLLQEMLEIPALFRALSIPSGGSVLEIGCGRGIALPVLAGGLRPERLVGIDIDRNALTAAAIHIGQRGIAAELYVADARVLPFAAGSFDLVLDFGTCFHIGVPECALHEVARVLSSGGLFVSETPLSQVLSHPLCKRNHRLPWHAVPELAPYRHALLWQARRRR